MFAPKFNTPTMPADYSAATLQTTGAVAESFAVTQPELGQADAISSAHEAVEVVLHAVEHVASREQKSVQLKFSVGEAELSVRVELHANEVRTTFRTESPELRAALAQEWNQVSNATTADRSVRVAPAVFDGGDHSGSNASTGDNASRQRNPESPVTEGDRLVAAARSRRAVSRSRSLAACRSCSPSRVSTPSGTRRV
jgi:hypothetical protein